jgi:hypothetical protein
LLDPVFDQLDQPIVIKYPVFVEFFHITATLCSADTTRYPNQVLVVDECNLENRILDKGVDRQS